MKRLLLAAALAATTTHLFAADMGVSIAIGQPGFFGRIDIGDRPQPPVIYQQPRLIQPMPMERAPIYLRVPPGHAKHWHKHCHEYNACGERVYFVQDGWYNREYAPRYREQYQEPYREHDRDRPDQRRDGTGFDNDPFREDGNRRRDRHR